MNAYLSKHETVPNWDVPPSQSGLARVDNGILRGLVECGYRVTVFYTRMSVEVCALPAEHL